MNANLTDLACQLGSHSADAYYDEFGVSPREDGAERVGDWDSSAWSNAEKELRDAGMTNAEHESCLAAWRKGFWI